MEARILSFCTKPLRTRLGCCGTARRSLMRSYSTPSVDVFRHTSPQLSRPLALLDLRSGSRSSFQPHTAFQEKTAPAIDIQQPIDPPSARVQHLAGPLNNLSQETAIFHLHQLSALQSGRQNHPHPGLQILGLGCWNIRDIKVIASLRQKPLLAFLDQDRLVQDQQPIRPLRFARTVVHLRDLFPLQGQFLESPRRRTVRKAAARTRSILRSSHSGAPS